MSIQNVLLAVACSTLLTTAALGQDKPAAKSGKDRPCAADAKKFCSDVRPGEGRIYGCLTSHDAELAPACRQNMAQAKARYEEFAAACKADADKYCKAIKPGHGRVLSCLKGRESDLAPACKAHFNRAKNDAAATQ